MSILFSYPPLVLIIGYLLWSNYQSSPKRMIKTYWQEIRANAGKIYSAREARDMELLSRLQKENDEKGQVINSLLEYYYHKDSSEYDYYKYGS